MLIVNKTTARYLGLASIACIALIEAFISFSCHNANFVDYLDTLKYLLIPMAPAMLSLLTKNPLLAVGSSLFFAPWLIFGYYVDCVAPYSGGGASMMYVAIVIWGLLTAIIGLITTIFVMKMLDISVSKT